MSTPVPVPPELLRATKISWTMENNHGLAESPFSGHAQAQRGMLERWKFEMEIPRLNRKEAAIAQGFFLQIEGRLGTFLMHDPAQPAPLGKALGIPLLAGAHAAGARDIATDGWKPNTPGILHAGDWIQIGDQLCKVRLTVDSSATGTATVSIWPKLMLPAVDNSPIITRPARGIFRYLTEMPAWETEAALKRGHTFRLTGTQVVLLPPP